MSGETLPIIGRILLGVLFVVGGIKHFGELAQLAEAVRDRGVPAPRLSLVLASVFQIVAGAMLMIGLLVPWAVLGLILFTLVSGFVMLDFWNKPPEAKEGMINVWMSNLAIIGGLLLAAAVEV